MADNDLEDLKKLQNTSGVVNGDIGRAEKLLRDLTHNGNTVWRLK
jgi:hypothetical protein